MTTWRKLIEEEMERVGDSWNNLVSLVPEGIEDVEFDSSFGEAFGTPFTLWTAERVYFPVEYDGSESVWSVARNPDGKATDHISRPFVK
jgi:hypothetical protein